MDMHFDIFDDILSIVQVIAIFVLLFTTFMSITPELFVLKLPSFYTHVGLSKMDVHIHNLDLCYVSKGSF